MRRVRLNGVIVYGSADEALVETIYQQLIAALEQSKDYTLQLEAYDDVYGWALMEQVEPNNK